MCLGIANCNYEDAEAERTEANRKPANNCETPTDCPSVKLLELKVIGATQEDVEGPTNWAATRHPEQEIIVEAVTDPAGPGAWNQLQWSGDGVPVEGQPNQRRLSRAESKVFKIEVALGGVRLSADVWIVAAEVTILTTGTTPPDAVQFGYEFDGTEELGAKLVGWGAQGRGKIVAVAQLTPAGVGSVVNKGWTFRREYWARNFVDGEAMYGKNWSRAWKDDTSRQDYQKLTPKQDRIYDRDAPSIGKIALSKRTYEVALNFRQWVEWHGEQCSDYAPWHFRARWKLGETPEITSINVGTGVIQLPEVPFYDL